MLERFLMKINKIYFKTMNSGCIIFNFGIIYPNYKEIIHLYLYFFVLLITFTPPLVKWKQNYFI